MKRCDVCGNEYDRAFTLRTADGVDYTFDSFECAISKCAPECGHCGCRIIGHGVEVGGMMYCCANCARAAGQHGVADHAEAPS